MTYAEQFVKAKNEDNEETGRRLIAETKESWDNNLWYVVFPDGSVYERHLCVTYTAEEIINAAPNCLYHKNGENELQKWLLDTVCDITGKPRVTARVVSA